MVRKLHTAQAAVTYQHLADTTFTPPNAWSPGNYRVYVRAYSSTGAIGAWSAPLDFTLIDPAADYVAVRSGDRWYLDADGNQCWNTGGDLGFRFGVRGDQVVVGDWNGDGVDDVGVHRGDTWYLDADGNQCWNADGDVWFRFGVAGDQPVVGDWNGDGVDDIGVHRGNMWYVDADGNRRWNADGDVWFRFGVAGDQPVVGDWNGDGVDDVGVHRGNMWYLDVDGNRRWNADGDVWFGFGIAGDEPVVGDWNGDGADQVGVHRGDMWYLDADGNRRWNADGDVWFSFGNCDDTPIVGRWSSPTTLAPAGLAAAADRTVPLIAGSGANASSGSARVAGDPSLTIFDDLRAADADLTAILDVTGTGTCSAGLVARYTEQDGPCMYLGALTNIAGTFRAEIWRHDDDGWTQLAAREVAGGRGLLRFSVVGATLELHFNDQLVCRASDGTILESGAVGARNQGAVLEAFTTNLLSTVTVDSVFANV